MEVGHTYLSMVLRGNRPTWKEKLALFRAGLEEEVKELRAVSHEPRLKEIRLRLAKGRWGIMPQIVFCLFPEVELEPEG